MNAKFSHALSSLLNKVTPTKYPSPLHASFIQYVFNRTDSVLSVITFELQVATVTVGEIESFYPLLKNERRYPYK